MRRIAVVILLAFLAADYSEGETYAVQDKERTRQLRVTREYPVTVLQGKVSEAYIPALMSFWGASNWQVVQSSEFTYSEEPDAIAITADNRGMPRRYYKLTWNAPKSNTINVKQVLDVELKCFNALYTQARLPYSDEVLEKYKDSLGADAKKTINPDNLELEIICGEILAKSDVASDVVEAVCDWINENIVFELGERTSDEALAQRKGSCTPMSLLACAMLRRIGIPAEVVSAKFIGRESGHGYIEAYYPDAGWVFYDLSNWNRGFKSLDCLATVGWAYRAGAPGADRWIDGHFCREEDKRHFTELNRESFKRLSARPKGKVVAGVEVKKRPAPASVRPRHVSLRATIMDLDIPPGKREYVEGAGVVPAAGTSVQKRTMPVVRIWTAQDGTTLEASFGSRLENVVILRKPDGSTARIRLNELSAEDREYVSELTGGR